MQGHFIALGSEDTSSIEVGLEPGALHLPLLSGFPWKTQRASSELLNLWSSSWRLSASSSFLVLFLAWS